MASRTYLAQLNLQIVSALDTVPSGFVGINAKSDGMYIRISGGSEKKLATTDAVVTSVGLSMPTMFTVSNSPVTGIGTINVTFANQSANMVFAAPTSSAGTPGFRYLVAADIPALNYDNYVAFTLTAGGSTSDINSKNSTGTYRGIEFYAGSNISISTSSNAQNQLRINISASGGGGLSGLTVNYFPIANSPTSIVNSSLYVDGTVLRSDYSSVAYYIGGVGSKWMIFDNDLGDPVLEYFAGQDQTLYVNTSITSITGSTGVSLAGPLNLNSSTITFNQGTASKVLALNASKQVTYIDVPNYWTRVTGSKNYLVPITLTDCVSIGINSAIQDYILYVVGGIYSESIVTAVKGVSNSASNPAAWFYNSAGIGLLVTSNTSPTVSFEGYFSSTNTYTKMADYNRWSTGTAAAGIGLSISYNIENATNLLRESARFITDLSVVTNGAEVGNMYWQIINGGTMGTRMTLTGAGKLTVAQYQVSAMNTAPATATTSGILGEIRYTSTYIYVCIATNTWRRVAIAAW